MTDMAIELMDFARSFDDRVRVCDLPGMHPAGAEVVHRLLLDMRDACEAGQAAEASRLMAAVTAKVAQEREWEAENLRDIERMRRGNR
jgi:hypothetical protein